MPREITTDILVLGSGLAGLLFAIKASRFGRVLVVTKKKIFEANTNYAQGGIAAAVDPRDSIAAHFKDTIQCGYGLCDESVVRKVIRDAPSIIEELEFLGVGFTKKNYKGPRSLNAVKNFFDFGLEGGHSFRRIVHSGDFTGRVLENALAERVRGNPNIRVMEDTQAIDLVLARDPHDTAAKNNRVRGAIALAKDNKEQVVLRSKIVVFATGGAGKVYLYTTNPDIATGDGMAMAARAGLPLANLEFVQFHPTCFYHPQLKNFLISEAVRGEGARLFNIKGERFMKRYDPRGELASRDIVARAIDSELKRSAQDYVLLDITHKDERFLRARFPNIFNTLIKVGINMAKDPIPVVPAAHYFCGGICVDEYGRTEMPGLFAIGEVSCSQFHGANRLASNSLLEACAFARYAIEALPKSLDTGVGRPCKGQGVYATGWGAGSLAGSDLNTLITHNWDEVRRLMSNYVGIVRSIERLERASRRLKVIELEVKELVKTFKPQTDLVELLNITNVARLIVNSALKRRESRGLHFMLDYPKESPKFATPTIVRLEDGK